MHDTLPQIALIALLAISAQWIGWRFKIPSIVFLLLLGFLAGPLLGFIQPEPLFGNLLQPAVSLAVAIILFEGSLNLNLKEIKVARKAISRFVYIGAPVGWVLTACAAHYIGGLSWPVATTFGALLIVTGPTVIIPLLKHARLNERTGSILKWEGIVNDPIGAVLAILTYEYFYLTGNDTVTVTDFFLKTGSAILLVSILSAAMGYVIAKVLNRGWVPEYLKPAFILSSVIILFVACNSLQHEAGLIGVTLLGIVLANLNVTSIEEIRRFKETMTIMLVSGVFVILTATLEPSLLLNIDWRGLLFIAAVLFLVRPAVAISSSLFTQTTWKEMVLLSWIAPRGIVCAAIAGIMGPLLVDAGYADGNQILPLAFAIVVITVFLHGLSANYLGRKLGLSYGNSDGLLIVGSSDWVIQFAEVLKAKDIAVMIADRNWHALKNVRLANIPAYYGEPLSDETEYNLELSRYNKLLAAADNPEYNALLCSAFGHEFGKENVFQLSTQDQETHERRQIAHTIKGRVFSEDNLNYWDFARMFRQGWRFRATKIDKEHNLAQIMEERENETAKLIAVVRSGGKLQFRTPDHNSIKDGDIAILFEKDAQAQAAIFKDED
ncbi:MAG: cation:proton antiporter [Pseudobdellovibrionaceae bacterium]